RGVRLNSFTYMGNPLLPSIWSMSQSRQRDGVEHPRGTPHFMADMFFSRKAIWRGKTNNRRCQYFGCNVATRDLRLLRVITMFRCRTSWSTLIRSGPSDLILRQVTWVIHVWQGSAKIFETIGGSSR